MRTTLYLTLGILMLLAWSVGASGAGEAAASGAAPEGYRISIGDTLSITVAGEDNFTKDCQVNGSGTISYPKLGDISAVGLTCGELRTRLDRGLRTYLRHPQVEVVVRQYGQTGMSVFVMGEVVKPGPYPLANGSGFLQALAAAGGPTEGASGEVSLMKGRTGKTYRFLLTDLGKSGSPSARLRLEPGDVMLVQRKGDTRYAILGEVPRPGMYDIPPRSEVRVLDAVQQAGILPTQSTSNPNDKPRDVINDPTRAADLEHARLTRSGKDTPLDLVALLRGDTTQNVLLRPGDVLTIPRRAMIHVYATGEVRAPGLQTMPQPSTVLDLLNVAGGLTTSARPGAASLVRMVSGKTQSTPVNLGDLVGKGDLKQNRALQEGDVLYVPPQKGPSQWPSVVSALGLLLRIPW